MKAAHHLLLGVAAGAAFVPAAGVLNSAVFFGASILIDIDHYSDFIYHNRFRSLSPRAMFRFHALLSREQHRREFLVLHVFHTVELLGALAFAGFYWSIIPMQFLSYGMCFHLLCDTASIIAKKTMFCRAISVFEYVVRKRRLRRLGLSSTALLREVARRTLDSSRP